MLKKESDRIRKIPRGEPMYQEDDRPDGAPVISEDELRRKLEITKIKQKRISRLTDLVISRDASYKASGERFEGYSHAYLVCTKALYPDEEKIS